MHNLLENLIHLDSRALHTRATEAVKRQAVAAWELAACLLAMEKAVAYRLFQCASMVEYAERQLGLGALKTLELLRGARVLEQFPLLSAACRDGRLCWSKLRELTRVVTAETAEAWLEFALAHSTREIERAVAVSPGQFRREQAGVAQREQPSLENEAAPEDDNAEACGAASTQATSEEPAAATSTTQKSESRPTPPAPPKLVKVELWMTADQFAIWDESLERVRSQKKRHVSKEVAVETIARHYLAGGDTRTRTNHPVVLRVESTSGIAFYETSRGVMPASPEAVEDALARERVSFVADPAPRAGEPTSAEEPTRGEAQAESAREQPLQRSGRTAIPTALRREALARANHRCQRCGDTRRLEVDHIEPVCDGGSDAHNLQALCDRCHALKHAESFASDARYIRGRAAGMAQARRRREAGDREPAGEARTSEARR